MSVGSTRRKRVARAMVSLAAGCACLAVLPSALAAVSGAITSADDSRRSVSISAGSELSTFTPASANPRLLASLEAARNAAGGDAGMFRFTPAGIEKAGNRAVTVAVRVDAGEAHAVSMRKVLSGGEPGLGISGVAPVAYNLGLARGYQSFAQNAKIAPVEKNITSNAGLLPEGVREIDAPDLTRFTPAKKVGDSRFGTLVELDEGDVPGRAPRTFGDGEQSVDVAGSYRVTGNFKVTAGVRYSAERNRLGPVSDAQQDNQSVYVGTRFRF
ncbi:hypothetical protein [Croceicoccus mobilis]|uniref:hypothetical protein n=1 Tax=Croceicoccus mobilis TaxID=1703339 RepID=UPI000B1ED48A|nr:hypothetical protein [Croceicoccus mobilis]